jgi:hypothetical protein
MTPSAASKSDLEHRLDHENFGEVYQVHYKEGIIKDFGLSSTNPLTLDDTCTVEVDGGAYPGVPIFYHCRRGYYDDQVATKRESGALNHGAWAFRAGQAVKVMMDGDVPYAVIGHNEPQTYGQDSKAPRKCLDVFRIQWHRAIGGGRVPYQKPISPIGETPGWLNWFMFQTTWHSIFYRASIQEEVTGIDDPFVEPDGNPIELPHRAKHIFGMREQQYGTVVFYLGDWLIVVGPAAYILSVYAVGMPGPITGSVWVNAGIWTPEREEIWLENARRKEQVYGTGGGHFVPINTDLLTGYPYVDTHIQSKFTKTFMDRFKGIAAGYSPKWILTEFWTYDWDREATDPNTFNTPAG